ncbi:SusC/RagA family TonB-linked outer membrane protein [Flammeovirga pacifica]|uniref:TonB-dependent receptor plug domain-containing protein n=1 Tax=Flammeovirga pacifica TaxID=915059 RepID=A0A1S1YSZ5_FLAPC|nr:TonB-dependent receptor [Flammeovirga pacifica]OHX64152.1 hypothetical protein NH26_21340 [Flammeovirga pacifica]
MKKGSLLFVRMILLTVLSFGVIDAFAQTRVISGSITDESNAPLVGANILIEGTSNGTIADFDGKYSLEIPQDASKIVVSFVGYLPQTLAIGTQSIINVTLEPDAEQLDEIVIVGYGTQEKVNVTGAVAQVDGETLSVPTPDAAGALQGRVAGVQINNGGTAPGDMPQIRVRGVTTLGSANQPLVVIDGIVSSYENFGMLANSDIESISVLKDGASASIYGARAAAGVILVTTKQGKVGKPKVTYEGYVGIQTMTRRPEYVDKNTWANIMNDASLVETGNPRYNSTQMGHIMNDTNPNEYGNTNWLDEVYRNTAAQQSHYINVSGGTEKTKYLASFGFLDQDGFLQTTDNYKRYNTKLNLSSKLSDKFTLRAQMAFTRQERQRPADLYRVQQAINTPSLNPATYTEGEYAGRWSTHHPARNNFFENPLIYLNTADRIQKQNTLQSFAALDYEITKGLKVTARTSMNYRNDENNQFTQNYEFLDWKGAVMSNPLVARGEEWWTNDLRIVNDIVVNYNVSLGKHKISALAGIAEEFYRYDEISTRRFDFVNNELRELAAGSQAGQLGTTTATDWTLQSYFGRLNYNFDGKYLLEGNLRADVSSRFKPGNRTGIFPSVSAGWRLAEESFFKDNVSENFIADAKIRASYGQLGNQAVFDDNYPWMPRIANADYPFYNEMNVGKAQTTMVVDDISWETTHTYNLGVDLDFFQGKLGASFDVFKKVTDDILLRLPVSSTSGLTAPVRNAGQLENQGWEIDLRYNNETKGGLRYSIGANVSSFQNTITDLKGAYSEFAPDFREGDAIGTIYGYKNLGIYTDQKQVDLDNAARNGDKDAIASGGIGQTRDVRLGDIRYADVNGDGQVNFEDMVNIGNTLAKLTYGINVDLGYKSWDFSMFWQGAGNIDGYAANLRYAGNGEVNIREEARDTYNEISNPTGTFPRISVNGNTQNEQVSDYWVQSAAYLRLKNIQVGYTLPAGATKAINVEKMRFYVSGQNVLTFTNFDSGLDPEMVAPMQTNGSFGGHETNARPSFYPTVSVYTVGLQATF